MTDMTESGETMQNVLLSATGTWTRSSDPLRDHSCGFFLMQDDARPHVAIMCWHFLEDKGIDAMDWPYTYPDLKPIKHIWDTMSGSARTSVTAWRGRGLECLLCPHGSAGVSTGNSRVTGAGSGIGGVPSGDHLPPHQEHAQTM